VNQRINKPPSWRSQSPERTSPFAPRPFAVQTQRRKGDKATAEPVTEVVQRKPLNVTVTGLTHLVTAVDDSLMEGTEEREVEDGTVVEIETDDELMSRRGPNQEIYAMFDREEKVQNYRWFRVLKVGEAPASPDTYIRDDSFYTQNDDDLDKRKLTGKERERVKPEEAELYDLARQIIEESQEVPGINEVLPIVNAWSKKLVSVHNPIQTLRSIQIAYAFGTNKEVRQKLSTAKGIEEVKKIGELLRSICGLQIVQDWADQPATTLDQRTEAWIGLRLGVEQFKDNAVGLSRYLADLLAHDKGYRQSHEASSRFLLIDDAPDERDFDSIWQEALAGELNINIWAGQLGSGKISDQLRNIPIPKADFKTEQDKAKWFNDREKSMWGNITTQLMTTKLKRAVETPADLVFSREIAKNEAKIFATVESLAKNLTLHRDFLKADIEALTSLIPEEL